MQYILYKTTNLVNGKFYIGIHGQEGDDFDGYLGSGKLIKQAIEKYGKNSFSRETMSSYPTLDKVKLAEENIVNHNLILDPLCYNLCQGGSSPPLREFWDEETLLKQSKSVSGPNERMRLNNPSQKAAGEKHWSRNRVSAIDLDGNTFSVFKDDPRYVSGELVSVNKGKSIYMDKDGNSFSLRMDDPLVLNGTFVSYNKGKPKPPRTPEHQLAMLESKQHKVKINDMIYKSFNEAGIALDMNPRAVRHRCKGNLIKWKGWSSFK